MKLLLTYIFALLAQFGFSQVFYNSSNIRLLSNINKKFDPRMSSWHQVGKEKEYLFIGNVSNIVVFDITSPSNPLAVDSINSPNLLSEEIYVHDGKLIAHNLFMNLEVYDLRYLPDSLHSIGTIDESQFSLYNSHFSDTLIFKLNNGDIKVFNISNLLAPVLIDSLQTDFPYLNNCKSLSVKNNTIYASYPQRGLYKFVFENHRFIIKDSLPHFFSNIVSNYGHCVSPNNQTICTLYEPTTLDANFYTLNAQNKLKLTTSKQLSISNYTLKTQYISNDWLIVSNIKDGINIYSARDVNKLKLTGYFNCFDKNNPNNTGVQSFISDLPSGTIIVRDKENGIFLLDPTNALSNNKEIEINPVESFSMILLPNPCQGSIKIELKREYPCELYIYNSIGDLVFQRYFQLGINDLVFTENMPNGVYLAVVNGNEGRLSKKFVVSH